MITINHIFHQHKIALIFLFLLIVPLALPGCNHPQNPEEYLDTAIDWIAANAINADEINWTQLRAEAQDMATGAQTTADTYTAIIHVLDRLHGGFRSFDRPEDAADARHYGLAAINAEIGPVVVVIDPGGPAELAGVAKGDLIVSVEGQEPLFDTPYEQTPWFYDFEADGETLDLEIISADSGARKSVKITPVEWPGKWNPIGKSQKVGDKNIGYLFLSVDTGTDSSFAPQFQEIITNVDSPQTCGWIIDLRTLGGGDIWSYLAALGPFLGEGDMGGFLYADGRRELWERRDNRVYWDGEKRYESEEINTDYQLEIPDAPVALLTSPLTNLAGELVLVAFRGRENVRTFGEPSRGRSHFQAANYLDDGAVISLSGALAFDREGTVYTSKIDPDKFVTIDWQNIGQEDDPVIQAAKNWLVEQPICTQ